jgi:hypothetical protein
MDVGWIGGNIKKDGEARYEKEATRMKEREMGNSIEQ